ncbi:uncharacterized protein GJ701_018109 [Geothlypis trichas]
MKLGMCQDEPEQLDDWNRIAELQRRNQARPPHLKTSYPLESMPSTSLGTITDEDVKMGDPEETLQRGSRQSSQRSSQASSITTRQRRKRLSEETHQGPDTPRPRSQPAASHGPRAPRTAVRRVAPRSVKTASSEPQPHQLRGASRRRSASSTPPGSWGGACCAGQSPRGALPHPPAAPAARPASPPPSPQRARPVASCARTSDPEVSPVPACWLCPGLPPAPHHLFLPPQGPEALRVNRWGHPHDCLAYPTDNCGVLRARQGPLALPVPIVILNPSGTQGKGMHRG